MIICDKCKKALPTKIVVFGRSTIDYDILPSWDLCEDCEKKIFEHIESLIGVKGYSRR